VQIKENYDKKYEGLVSKFKEIEEKFINGEFEEKIFGELKNSKDKQKEIVARVTNILTQINELSKDVESLKHNHHDLFMFENKLETLTKDLTSEEWEFQKYSFKIADYGNVDINLKFEEMLQNIFILKKYS